MPAPSDPVARPSSSPGRSVVGIAILAVLGHLTLLDAAVETFWSGSPLRWWVMPVALIILAFSVSV